MNTHHSSKYRFVEPRSIREAKDRLKALLLDIRNIEKQLGDHVRTNRDGVELTSKEYVVWHSRTRASLVYKQNEYQELKDWVRERRREIESKEVKIEDPNDPRQLLLAAHAVLRSVMDGDAPAQLGHVFSVIDQHLIHAA
jgi:hypothetical protein